MNQLPRLLLAPSLLILAAPACARQEPAGTLELQAAELRGEERSLAADYGTLTVPLHHDEPAGQSIQLAVLVRRSTASEPGPPTIFLNGIPDSAVEQAGEEHWDEYLELGDLVFLDQRGAGRSEPALSWERPPYKAELLLSDRESALKNLRSTARAIKLFTTVVGIDISAFNTRESARDVDMLRRALGHETMRLIGYSGGSHLGFEVVRRFGEHVERFVSIGTAGPGEIHSLPSELDDFLRKISRLAARDERIGEQMPDLYERVEAALDRVEREPLSFEVQHPDGGKPVTLRLGRHGLQFLLMLELGDPEELALFPRLVHELEHGRSDLLRWFVELRYHQLSEFPALLFINRAASGATPARWKRIRSEAAQSLFGLVRCLFSPELDDAFGVLDLGDSFRAPVASEIPTLFVSATLDGKTPPERAERARAGFPNSTHLVLENGGHNDLTRDPRIHERILNFLDGFETEDERLPLPPMRFALLEGEDPLVSHRALD